MTERGIDWIDRLCERIGTAVSWVTLLMVIVCTVVVLMRYAFDRGFIWMQESVTWMHALIFMLGAASTLRSEGHVRVDVFYRKLAARGQAWVDVAGSLLFLMPLAGYLLYTGWAYFEQSWQIGERSREAGGMRTVYLLKAVIPVTGLLLILQGCSEALRAWRRAQRARRG
jgi:TRAP-type mannitol/chloroaromatic compound transport system permease small subunit